MTDPLSNQQQLQHSIPQNDAHIPLAVAISGCPSSATQVEGGEQIVVVPSSQDVISGRGPGELSNPGNIRLYETIGRVLPEYQAAPDRKSKSRLVDFIYNDIRTQARFVQADKASGICHLATEQEAKNKISHAIRYRIKAQRRKSQQGQQRQKSKPSTAARASMQETSNNTLDTAPTELEIFTDEELESALDRPGFFELPNSVPDLEWLELVFTSCAT